eukprot:887696-Prorocentrum_lima.AAC.1
MDTTPDARTPVRGLWACAVSPVREYADRSSPMPRNRESYPSPHRIPTFGWTVSVEAACSWLARARTRCGG